MYSLITTLQIIVYMPIYNQVYFPASTLIFLTEMRKMAEFKVVELEDLKTFFGIDFEEQLNQTAYANAGIESYSFT
jgi:hypothetical protein